ncbi:MAG: GNAT family N-acetyltransferase [Gemmatimonadota bacterium]
MGIEIRPATRELWSDLAALFGARGACGGCWCMFWRQAGAEFAARKGEKNRRALRRLVQSDEPPGLIAWIDGEPAGWIAVAPRAAYRRLERSRILKPVDNRPDVWSVPCFFVARAHRRQGLTVALLEAAVEHAARRGAAVVEGYPVEPAGEQADVFVYTGLASAFRRAGFREAARRSPTRPVMRYEIEGRPKRSKRVAQGGPSA